LELLGDAFKNFYLSDHYATLRTFLMQLFFCSFLKIGFFLTKGPVIKYTLTLCLMAKMLNRGIHQRFQELEDWHHLAKKKGNLSRF